MSMRTDFLVIGSGIAGLNFALLAAKHGSVVVATKKSKTNCATMHAQGGIAAVSAKSDSFESHIKDTLEAGRWACKKEAVELMVRSAPKAIEQLMELGVPFDSDDGETCLGIEGGHSARRILHVKDWTGEAIEKTFVKNIENEISIEVKENCTAICLIKGDGRCIGASFLQDDEIVPIFSKTTFLATGGAGMVYSVTSNPETATGDGYAIARQAGCTIRNMEFVQFHPTTLNVPDAPHFLLSEALRGEGARLVNCQGKRFMENICPKAELAPRDVVTLAIARELKNGQVFLDISHLDSETIQSRFPCIYNRCMGYGIDITQNPIPITPAAHFMCGGIRTDISGRTSIPGLYAAGEVAYTGVHGANRLASNSLLEAMVFSEKAAEEAVRFAGAHGIESAEKELPKINDEVVTEIKKTKDRIRSLMWDKVGIIRTEKGLEEAFAEIEKIEADVISIYEKGINREIIELRNLIKVAKMITKMALKRKKSLGCHRVE